MNSKPLASDLQALLAEIKDCRICQGLIPEPNPVVKAGRSARVLIIGQAPGTKVHKSGIPWDDVSGKRLRNWMGLESDAFYDDNKVAIVPMGFCYPGKGKSGDLPPRPECVQQWHERLLSQLSNIQCTLLIGQYAQNHYLNDNYKTLTERVEHWRDFAPKIFVLPHPSPRNQIWLKKNPWFEEDAVPQLRKVIENL